MNNIYIKSEKSRQVLNNLKNESGYITPNDYITKYDTSITIQSSRAKLSSTYIKDYITKNKVILNDKTITVYSLKDEFKDTNFTKEEVKA